MATREEDLFRQYNDKLVNAIVEPTALAVSFYSKNMIAREVKDRVCEVISVLSKRDKSGILLDAIEQYISTQPDSQKRSSEFLRVLSVLKNHIPVDTVAKSMEKEYRTENASASAGSMSGK